MSSQSIRPSQIHSAGIHRPVSSHWNWSSLHAVHSQKQTLSIHNLFIVSKNLDIDLSDYNLGYNILLEYFLGNIVCTEALYINGEFSKFTERTSTKLFTHTACNVRDVLSHPPTTLPVIVAIQLASQWASCIDARGGARRMVLREQREDLGRERKKRREKRVR